MHEIPVYLTHKGKKYEGVLTAPSGGGANTFHFSINDFHRGSLSFSERHGWTFQTQEGRFDEWALVLGKFVEETYPERSFKPHLPPPFKMLEFEYDTLEMKALIEVHSTHGGSYYLKIRNRVVNGIKKPGFDEAYFMRRQVGDSEPGWHFTNYWYKDLFTEAGLKVEQYEKDWKSDENYRLIRDKFTMAMGYVLRDDAFYPYESWE